MKRAGVALVTASLLALLLAWVSSGRPPRRFADSEGYLNAAAQPLDLAFFASARPPFELGSELSPEDGLYRNRPWLVPLLYRACSLEPTRIVHVQLMLYALGAGIGLVLLSSTVPDEASRAWPRAALATSICAALALAWYLAGWTRVLLSEALVLALAWVAAGGVASYLARGGRAALVLTVGATGALLFARDSGGLLSLPLLAGAALVAASTREWRRARALALGALVLLPLFLGAQWSAARGHRALLPIANVLLVRVAPDPAALGWWRARGLPWNAELERFSGRFAFEDDLELFRSARHAPFLRFVDERGRGLLLRFLLGHPGYVLRETWRGREDLFGTELATYVGAPPALVAPIDSVVRGAGAAGAGLVLALWAVVVARRSRPRAADLAPFVIAAAFLLHGLAALHADAAEPERHCFPTTFGLQLAAATALFRLAPRGHRATGGRPAADPA